MPTGGSTSTSSAVMPKGFDGLFKEMGRAGVHAFNRGSGLGVYKGEGVADFSPMQREAFANIPGAAARSDRLANTGVQTLQGIMQREPGSSPYIDDMADIIRRNAGTSTAAAMGGSGRFGSMLGTAAMARSMNDAETGLRYNAYQGDTANSMQAAGMMPQAQAALGAGNNMLMGAGALQQQMQQQKMDWRQGQFYARENAPWTQIGLAGATLRGMPFGTANTVPGPSPWASALGMGMGAAGIGGMLMGSGGPWGQGGYFGAQA